MTKLKKTFLTDGRNYDIAIIGAGPAGLAFAASLKNLGLDIALIEKNAVASLENPADDGREVALTHTSLGLLEKLGMLRFIPAGDRAPIRQAKVMDGTSPYALSFDPRTAKKEALGHLVSNRLIRRAAWLAVKGQKGLEMIAGVEVSGIEQGEARHTLTLSNGTRLAAKLVVAADGRFSRARNMMGIPTRLRDFGRTVIVCRVDHDKPHHETAYECFHYGRTLAILPLKGNQSSAVTTLSSQEAPAFLAMSEKEFNADLTRRFGNQLGGLRLAGKRHAYPLVATYAERFVGNRFALIGDAAVGMHPVTAHGYNFGLFGQDLLAGAVREALSLGLDIGDAGLLAKFDRAHRKATLPIYLGTNFLVGLFTDESKTGKVARKAVLHAGNLLLPFKKLVTRHLTATMPAA